MAVSCAGVMLASFLYLLIRSVLPGNSSRTRVLCFPVMKSNSSKPSPFEDKKVLKAGAAAGAAAGALAVLSPVALVPIAGVMAVKKFTLNSRIKEQQYSCAVMKFYLDDLSKFLGL